MFLAEIVTKPVLPRLAGSFSIARKLAPPQDRT